MAGKGGMALVTLGSLHARHALLVMVLKMRSSQMNERFAAKQTRPPKILAYIHPNAAGAAAAAASINWIVLTSLAVHPQKAFIDVLLPPKPRLNVCEVLGAYGAFIRLKRRGGCGTAGAGRRQ